LGAAGYFYLSKAMKPNWGHHFTFENKLGINIDSLEISVGNIKTVVYPTDTNELESNLKVPVSGYPHKVDFKVYKSDGSLFLKADAFDCYNCDGTHGYILKPEGAEYKFYN